MSATDCADAGNVTQDDKTQDVYDYSDGLEDGHETNMDVSYLKPLYGTVGDGASWSTKRFFLLANWCDRTRLLTLFPEGGSVC
jgi:hypothetical protein